MKKSAKNNSGGIHIHLTNRWLYTLVALVVVLVAAVGVYAASSTIPGDSSSTVIPNPGHPVSDLQVCDNGKILETVNGQWNCVSAPSGIPTCANGQILYYSNGWTCQSDDPAFNNWYNGGNAGSLTSIRTSSFTINAPQAGQGQLVFTGTSMGGGGRGASGTISGSSCSAFGALVECYSGSSTSGYVGVCSCVIQYSNGATSGTWKFVA